MSATTSLSPAPGALRAIGAIAAICTGIALLGAAPAAHAASATRTSAFDYEAASGLLVREVIEPADSILCVVTTYQMDGHGNRTSATTRNCNGTVGSSPANNNEAAAPTGLPVFPTRQTSSAYPDPRFASTITNALNQSETRAYNASFGVVTSITGPNLLATEWAYDGFGRKTLERRPDGNGTKWTYALCTSVAGGTASCPTIGGYAAMHVVTTMPVAAPINIAAQTTGAQNGPAVKAYHDAQGRVIRQETQGFEPTGTAPAIYQDTEYNALGQVYRQSRPYFSGGTIYWTTNTLHDGLGRVSTTTTPDGGLVTNTYNGLTTSVTVKALDAASTYGPATQTTSQTRDVVGQVVNVTDANGKTLTRGFDPFGNLTSTTDAAGNVTTITYDTRGRKKTLRDRDMGFWEYDYNALGELVWQRNAKLQVFTMGYDVLGRLRSRVAPDLSSNWAYDTYQDGSACNKGIGKLCEALASNQNGRRHSYDSLGRLSSTSTTVGGATYVSSVTYDSAGRIDTQTYPTGMVVRNLYTPLSYLHKVSNVGTGTVYWQATGANAEGQITQYTLGNGLTGTNVYQPSTGRVTGHNVGPSNSVQGLTYGYDYVGNLRSRADSVTGVSAQYDYDALNRMRSEVRSGGGLGSLQTLIWAYDDIGNITSRSDVGTYTYPPSGPTSVRPHAVSSVAGTVNGVANPTYGYDANGNLTGGAGRTLTWMSFDMPADVMRGSNKLEWQYDADHQRASEKFSVGGVVQRTTTYINPAAGAGLHYEYEIGFVAGAKQKHYISAGGETVAVATFTGSTWSTQYWHKDHLGSTSVVTNETGALVERLSYEPFGKRRNSNGTTDPNGTLAAATDRGFTGHEMLDEVGLVHMNGRIFDPALSRFMSADPIVQAPLNLQSLNRYTYGFNNPLGGADPSGYSWLSKTWHKVWRSPVGRLVVTVAVAYFTGQYVDYAMAGSGNALWGETVVAFDSAPIFVKSVAGNIASGAAGGFAGGFVGSGGNLQAGLEGAVTGAGFAWAGAQGAPDSATRYAAHAGVGCVSGEMSGNGCVRGATSAFAAKWATNQTTAWAREAQFAATVVIGGATSVIGGGKFANGAISAGYGYLFNYCSGGKCTTKFEQAMYDYWPGYKAGTFIYNNLLGGGGESTAWEVVDLVAVGTGGASTAISAGLSGGARSVIWLGEGAADVAAILGTPIGSTPIGRALTALAERGVNIPPAVWEQASMIYANNAQGTVQLVIRGVDAANSALWPSEERFQFLLRGAFRLSRSKYPWPLSLLLTQHILSDGSVVWPSGREEYSFVFPSGSRARIVVANPVRADGQREWIIFAKTINKFTDGRLISAQERQTVIRGLEDYLRSTGRPYRVDQLTNSET